MPFITVVSGLPRSGTSMMMQMLSAGGMPVLADGARPADEDNPRGYFELESAKRLRHDAGWLAGAVGKAVKVIHLALPDLPADFTYRVVMMHRDLAEVLDSQQIMLRRHDRHGARLAPDRLAATFEAQLRRATEWARREAHVSLLEVHYRDVIRDPAAQAARVNEFLGGTLDVGKMSAAVDPALYRNRAEQPDA